MVCHVNVNSRMDKKTRISPPGQNELIVTINATKHISQEANSHIARSGIPAASLEYKVFNNVRLVRGARDHVSELVAT